MRAPGARLTMAVLVALTAASPLVAEGLRYRVIDRRSEDGSVILVPSVPRHDPGPDPFRAGEFWQLEPSTEFFRVRGVPVPASSFQPLGDPPALTLERGQATADSWTTALGGEGTTEIAPGEIVYLARLNTAFKTVRMDLETPCRRTASGRPFVGRIDFVLSGQVGRRTLAEANAAVSAQLKPLSLAEVMAVCDPETGESPPRIRPGQTLWSVEEALGPPEREQQRGASTLLQYGPVELEIVGDKVAAIRIPALD